MTEHRSLSDVFAATREANRAALIGYLPAGFPSRKQSADAFRALVDGGCDIVEVGMPYSDPVMDGPTIQAAATKALADGTKIADLLTIVEAISTHGGVPVVMTYWAPVTRYGVDAFARDLANAGGRGLITPDLIPDEAGEWLVASEQHGLDRIFLVAPSSTDERLAMTTSRCSGFVYAASSMGVTGARDQIGDLAPRLVERTRRVTDLPIGVGLGVRTPEHVREVASYADAVIVGSAFVTAVDHDLRQAGELVTALREATARS
ncbi:tryptophan synthase subunit alpha [Cumulibacter manganitolerans]|uniref:tryptophan synthase subunit alpha n=1 Tax=Cumulibacter manganitolerans TaxID=1884992 RepID=UPI001296D55D|nr:tryptophan synthase subunit alpha [Cumulibacter manganitolerans]